MIEGAFATVRMGPDIFRRHDMASAKEEIARAGAPTFRAFREGRATWTLLDRFELFIVCAVRGDKIRLVEHRGDERVRDLDLGWVPGTPTAFELVALFDRYGDGARDRRGCRQVQVPLAQVELASVGSREYLD